MLRDIDLFTHTDSVISSIRTEDVYRHMCVCVCVCVCVANENAAGFIVGRTRRH